MSARLSALRDDEVAAELFELPGFRNAGGASPNQDIQVPEPANAARGENAKMGGQNPRLDRLDCGELRLEIGRVRRAYRFWRGQPELFVVARQRFERAALRALVNRPRLR